MAANNLSSLSVGLMVLEMLSNDARVSSMATKVFPVVSEEGTALPYICYRQSDLKAAPVKREAGPDVIGVDVMCFAATYEGAVTLAEAVRAAMEGVEYTYRSEDGKLKARSIILTDAEDSWDGGAYAKSLSFEIKVNSIEQ